MDCKKCTEDLTAYLDMELSPEESAQVQSHLATCASCTHELRRFQAAADFVDSYSRKPVLNPKSWNAVRARISIEKSPSLYELLALNRWRAVLGALACITMLVLGCLWYEQAQDRNLNAYISQYVTTREADRSLHHTIAGPNADLESEGIFADNPFVEVKADLDLNPFRSEEQ